VHLQEMLVTLGYPLPRWGTDGDLGDETLRALSLYLSDHGQTLDDKNTVSNKELAIITKAYEALPALPGGTVDMRAKHAGVHRYGKRPWSKVTGVTLHQTACLLGENPTRWKDIGCHWGVTRSGKAIYLSDPTWLVAHGNGLNGSDIGIEIDGYYAGIEGDPSTLWRPEYDPKRKPLMATSESIDSVKQIVRYTTALVASNGGKLRYIHAHRQASVDRRSDPGSHLWRHVGMALMAELDLADGGKGWTVGSGLPIPEAWDARYKGVLY
jgi:hypothetical protein